MNAFIQILNFILIDASEQTPQSEKDGLLEKVVTCLGDENEFEIDNLILDDESENHDSFIGKDS